MSTYSDLKGGSAGSATTVYSTIGDLPLSDNIAGTQAYVSGTNRLYIWNGTGWFNIALINTNPEITTGGASSYALASDGTATEITLVANDPEGLPIAWSYAVTAGSLGSTATVSQNNNVFTITPSTESADLGSFVLTFTASDGINLATSVSSFGLAFAVHNSRYTSLSLQAASTGTNSTFVDSSSEGNTITNSGAVAGTFSPYRNQGYSAHFGNNDAGITIAASSQLGIQGADFCIEAWVKPTSKIDPYPRILHGGAANWSTNDSWALLCGHDDADHGSGTKYSFAAVTISGNNAVLTSTTSIDFGGDWQHVCVTRSGTTLSLYINGTREDTATTSSNLNSSATNALSLGRNGDTNSSYHGYMRDIRIIKGSAFRDLTASGSFDIPTEPLTNVSGLGHTTSLLTCQGNKLTDSGDGNLSLAVQAGVSMEPITPYDSSGGYTESANGSSGYFGGNDNIRSTTVDLPVGGEPYTIEAWVYNTSSTRGTIANWGAQGTGQATSLRLNDAGNGFSHIWYAANLETNDIGVRPNVWYHVAGTYDGTTRRIFVNGVQRAQDTPGTHTTSVTNNFTIGEAFYSGANYVTGHLSDLRISDIARYSSGFSVPTAPHTADANTVFLLNPNPSIIDKAQGSNITLVGDASGSNTQQLFGSSTMTFDGSGDRVTATNVPNLGADFTVEAWVYANVGLGNAVIIASIDNVGDWGGNGHWALMHGSKYNFQIDGGGYTSTSTAPTAGVWQHIAVTRSSGTVRYFIDGVLDSTSYTNTSVLTNPSGVVVGSGPNNNYIYNWNGHLQDVRVTEGLARYTSNFTPPTALLEG